MTDPRIPAIVNVESGTADEAQAVLEQGEAFEVHAVKPDRIAETVRELVAGGAKRILVSGGDGTIATAAAVLMETPAEMAILPGGTLNHFARDLGVSTDAAEALKLAAEGACRGVDVGTVSGRVFLNTSSVGAYVRFVRIRERLERRFGYRVASALAAFRLLLQMRLIAVEVEVDGKPRIYRTPLVFIGVGERELQLPTLGSRVPDGKRGLHVMIVQGRTRSRLLALALAAVARGVKSVARTPQFDSFLVDRCKITVRRPGYVAVDGELVSMPTTLEYELRRDALSVVCPEKEPAELAREAKAASQ
ncbi:MAG TPA: diacylglycerol kinase family protein [Gemmatimonadaceae bacterium]|nr:diacylglycerol kinase family protein [Gemmatimonadaceae bacterium]